MILHTKSLALSWTLPLSVDVTFVFVLFNFLRKRVVFFSMGYGGNCIKKILYEYVHVDHG